MATIVDMPYELLYHIMFLLVQSSDGAADFARIISVCRNFLLFAEDERILKLVNFDFKMEFKNLNKYQHVNSVIVKCSEAGNIAAQLLLGKVILLSSSQLFLGKWHKVKFDVSPSDLAMLSRILETEVPAQNSKVSSFMTYFTPTQVYTSEFSQTRLVHYQLVKLFLLNGSHHDFIEMGVFLKTYIKCFTIITKEDSPLLDSIKALVLRAHRVRLVENLAKTIESFDDSFRGFREFFAVKAKHLAEYFEDSSSVPSGIFSDSFAGEYVFHLQAYLWKCSTVGVDWREAMSDVDFVEALSEDVRNLIDEPYNDFKVIRAETVSCFEHQFG